MGMGMVRVARHLQMETATIVEISLQRTIRSILQISGGEGEKFCWVLEEFILGGGGKSRRFMSDIKVPFCRLLLFFEGVESLPSDC